MIHLTVAVGRFAEIIIWQIAQATGLVIGALLIGLAGLWLAIGGGRRLLARFRRRR